jgi:CRISP-associated protein Cas1
VKKILYLRPNTTISLAEDPNWLVLLHPEIGYSTAMYELAQVRSLIAFAHIGFEPDVLPKLLQSGVSVVFFGGDGNFLGRLEPDFGMAPELLKAQIALCDDHKLYLTKQLVRAALRQHRRLLLRCQREQHLDLLNAIQSLDFAIQAICQKSEIPSVSALLGAGLQGYYQGIAQAIRSPGWNYDGRNSATPFTAMIAFGYRLLEQEIRIAIATAGLDPRFGLWHVGPDALAKDFATGCKPLIDMIVLRCINRGQVSLKDFDAWQPSLKSLPQGVREILHVEFEKKLGKAIAGLLWREALTFQVLHLVQFLLGKTTQFNAFEWK